MNAPMRASVVKSSECSEFVRHTFTEWRRSGLPAQKRSPLRGGKARFVSSERITRT
jgi:hypothetical protein